MKFHQFYIFLLTEKWSFNSPWTCGLNNLLCTWKIWFWEMTSAYKSMWSQQGLWMLSWRFRLFISAAQKC